MCWYLSPIIRKSSQEILVNFGSFRPFRQSSDLHIALALLSKKLHNHGGIHFLYSGFTYWVWQLDNAVLSIASFKKKKKRAWTQWEKPMLWWSYSVMLLYFHINSSEWWINKVSAAVTPNYTSFTPQTVRPLNSSATLHHEWFIFLTSLLFLIHLFSLFLLCLCVWLRELQQKCHSIVFRCIITVKLNL